MEIVVLKGVIGSCPRTKKGRRLLTNDLKAQIRECFKKSGMNKAQFGDAIGLSIGIIYKLLNQKGQTTGKLNSRDSFKELKVVAKPDSWMAIGPNGLRVECASLEQLTQLWRALC